VFKGLRTDTNKDTKEARKTGLHSKARETYARYKFQIFLNVNIILMSFLQMN
jgi:hypothetical protein